MFTSKNELYDETHCVAINIRFNLNNDLSTELRDIPCNISKCLLEVIDFDCFNETLINKDQGNGTGCEGNFYFELIQVLVVTVKNKNIIPLLYSHNYFCTSSSRVAFYFIIYILIIQDIDYLQLASNLFIMVAYFCHHLSDNYVDLSDLYVVLSDLYVDFSDLYVDLSLIHLLKMNLKNVFLPN